MRALVAIPTLGKSPLIWHLLNTLTPDNAVNQVWVYDTGCDPDIRKRLDGTDAHVVDWEPRGIYSAWNNALEMLEYCDVAILNDDIRLPVHAISRLTEMLHSEPGVGIVSPDYRCPWMAQTRAHKLRDVHGTYRQNGIAGFAFVVNHSLHPLAVDSVYEAWFGDDDLVAKIEAQGQRACIVEGLPIEHEESTTLNQTDWVPAAAARDRERWAGRP